MDEAGRTVSWRWRRRLAKLLHGLALWWLLLASYVILFGGFRYEIGNFSLSATHATNPFIFGVACILLGKLVAYGWSIWQTPIGRMLIWVRHLRRNLRQMRGAIIAAGVVAVLGLGGYRNLTYAYHMTQAEQLEAEGKNLQAAEHFEAAISWLDPRERGLRQRRAYCFWRAAKWQRCVGEMEPYFLAGSYLGKKGYRALWSCYRELGRLDEAAEVVRTAMSTHAKQGNECAGVLAELDREMAGVAAEARPVTFRYAPPKPVKGPLWLSGNWSKRGTHDEIRGYEPVTMAREDEGHAWTAAVPLKDSGDYPYAAHVETSTDLSSRNVIAFAQFRVGHGSKLGSAGVELEAVPPVAGIPPPVERKRGADGRRRVLALWPDGYTWFLLNSYVRRGLMPNTARLLENGARGEMMSTNPPFTSTAYLRMVELAPGVEGTSEARLLDTLAIQLKGVPLLDGFIPDSYTSLTHTGPTIFGVMAKHGLKAVNLVFNDSKIAAPTDMMANDGTIIEVSEEAAMLPARNEDIDEDTAHWVMREILDLDPKQEQERAQPMWGETIFLLSAANNHRKSEEGIKIWRDHAPDLLLLRLPATDIVSHSYYWGVEESPLHNLMLETYRHVDVLMGRLIRELDEDDTFILVSDHGNKSTLHHHRSCVLIVEGPGMQAQKAFDTLPIGHFPSVILSRFDIEEGASRLTDDAFAFFYGRSRTPEEREPAGRQTPGVRATRSAPPR